MKCPKCGSQDKLLNLHFYGPDKCYCCINCRSCWTPWQQKAIEEAAEIIGKVDTVFWPHEDREQLEKWLKEYGDEMP